MYRRLGLCSALGWLGLGDVWLARLGLGSSLAKLELASVWLVARGPGDILFAWSCSGGTGSEKRLGFGRTLFARLGFGGV